MIPLTAAERCVTSVVQTFLKNNFDLTPFTLALMGQALGADWTIDWKPKLAAGGGFRQRKSNQIKQNLLSNYLRQELRSPSVRIAFA